MQFSAKVNGREVLASGVLVLGAGDRHMSFVLDGTEFTISLSPNPDPLSAAFVRKDVKHIIVELRGQFPIFSASWKLAGIAQAGERQIDLDIIIYSQSENTDAVRQVGFSFTAHSGTTPTAQRLPDLLRFL